MQTGAMGGAASATATQADDSLTVAAFNVAIQASRPTEFCPPAGVYPALDALRAAYEQLLGGGSDDGAGADATPLTLDVPRVAVFGALGRLDADFATDPDAHALFELFAGRDLRALHRDARLFTLVKGFERYAAANAAGHARPVWSTSHGRQPPAAPDAFFAAIAEFLLEGGDASLFRTTFADFCRKDRQWLDDELRGATAALRAHEPATPVPDVGASKAVILLAMMLWDYVHDTIVRASVRWPAELVEERIQIAARMRQAQATSLEVVAAFLVAQRGAAVVVLAEMNAGLLEALRRRMGTAARAHGWRFLTEAPRQEAAASMVFTAVCVRGSVPTGGGGATDTASGASDGDAPALCEDLSVQWREFATVRHDVALEPHENVAFRVRLAAGSGGAKDLLVFGVHVWSNGKQSVAAVSSAAAFARARHPDCAYVYAGDNNVVTRVAEPFRALFAEGGALHGTARRANPRHLPTCDKRRLLTHQLTKVLQRDRSCKLVVVFGGGLRCTGFHRRLGAHIVGDDEDFVTPALDHGWLGDHAGVVAQLAVS